MPQILLPGDDNLTDCTFDDLARWDKAVSEKKAETREVAAAVDLKSKPKLPAKRRGPSIPAPSADFPVTDKSPIKSDKE